MAIAHDVSARSTCVRARVGAIVTDARGLQILGMGYNGAPRGHPNACARAEPGNCGCVHAELNALLKSPGALEGKVLYTTTAPCERCASAICNANVDRVVFRHEYRERGGISVLEIAGIALATIA